MNFFCTKKHYLEWLAEDGEEKQGFLLDAIGALAVARQIFGRRGEIFSRFEDVDGRRPE